MNRPRPRPRRHSSPWRLTPLLLIMTLSACQLLVVEDPLYDIAAEQAYVRLRVCYAALPPDVADQLPSRFPLEVTCRTSWPTGFGLSDDDGRPVTTATVRPVGTLSYEGYAQPGYYRVHSFAPAQGYNADSAWIEVRRQGGYVERRPAPLVGGHWERQLRGGDVVRDTVRVRQHTRQVVFRILLTLGDSLRCASSDAVLTDVHYRLDLLHDALDTTRRAPLPLRMQQVSHRTADGTTYAALVDTIRILSPTATQYARWGHNHTLTVSLGLERTEQDAPQPIQPVTYSFGHVLDEAYSQRYVEATGDTYCTEPYVWQAYATLTLDTLTSGGIVQWEVEQQEDIIAGNQP